MPGAIEDARAKIADNADTRARFKRVAELVSGFESSFGLELLATVHSVMVHEEAITQDAAIERAYEWNPRKRRFSAKQIGLARQVLFEPGWVVADDSQAGRTP